MSLDWKSFFAGKRATQLGLGLLGRGVQDAQFLSEHVEHLLVTDMKSESQLRESVQALTGIAGDKLTLVLGEHRLEDFEHIDFVLKGAGVPLASPYIAHARAQGVPVYMDESLFELCKPAGVRTIGVTGTRGKTTTTMLLHHILQTALPHTVHLGGNIRGIATLPLLRVVQPNDTVVLELSSWQLQGYRDIQYSPSIAVFTNFFADHLNYYGGSMEAYMADKAQIFACHGPHDVLIVSPQAQEAIDTYWHGTYKGVRVVVDEHSYPELLSHLHVPGVHNAQNAALAIAVAKTVGVDDVSIAAALQTFSGVSGRLEFVSGLLCDVYNDATSTTPDALRVALQTVAPMAHSKGGRVLLICGGAGKELSLDHVPDLLNQYADTIFTIPGTGTEQLLPLLANSAARVVSTGNLTDAVTLVKKEVSSNDIVLFSPGFASFGEFVNEFDRNDTFMRLVQSVLRA